MGPTEFSFIRKMLLKVSGQTRNDNSIQRESFPNCIKYEPEYVFSPRHTDTGYMTAAVVP